MRDASVAVCASQTEKRRPAPGLASGGVSLRCVDVLGWRCLWLAWGCSVSTKPSRSVPWLVTPLFYLHSFFRSPDWPWVPLGRGRLFLRPISSGLQVCLPDSCGSAARRTGPAIAVRRCCWKGIGCVRPRGSGWDGKGTLRLSCETPEWLRTPFLPHTGPWPLWAMVPLAVEESPRPVL